MRFAVLPPVRTGVSADPQWMAAFARHAEAVGFESIVVVEHAVMISGHEQVYPYSATGKVPLADDCDIPDPLELLAYLAGVTTTLGLATGVLILPEHHPVVLAKRLATLDRLSGGRLRLCVGVGWMREELEACGVEFSSRGRRTDESIDVLRSLWADAGEAGVSHHGEFFDFEHAHSHPKPAQAGGIPIHIGGHSDAAARRAGRRGDGFQPLGLVGDELKAKVAVMRQTAEDAGRDPDRLELSLGGSVAATTPASVEAAQAAGAGRLVVSPTPTGDLNQTLDELSAFADRMQLQPR